MDVTKGFDSEADAPEYQSALPVTPSSEMVVFHFSNNCVITVRTSGTEPKLKFVQIYTGTLWAVGDSCCGSASAQTATQNAFTLWTFAFSLLRRGLGTTVKWVERRANQEKMSRKNLQPLWQNLLKFASGQISMGLNNQSGIDQRCTEPKLSRSDHMGLLGFFRRFLAHRRILLAIVVQKHCLVFVFRPLRWGGTSTAFLAWHKKVHANGVRSHCIPVACYG